MANRKQSSYQTRNLGGHGGKARELVERFGFLKWSKYIVKRGEARFHESTAPTFPSSA